MVIRTMKSVNTRKPMPMHIMRAKLMKVSKWKQKPETRPLPLLCSRIPAKQTVQADAVPNPALEFAARQFYNILISSRMVAVFHHNGIDMETKSMLQKTLKKFNIQLFIIGNEAALLGTSGTKFTNMHPLFIGNNLFAVSEELNVKELLKSTRKLPNILLIGGLLEDQLMSAGDLENFASLPSIEALHSQLAGLLSSTQSTTCRYLQANQQALSMNLSQLQKQQNE
ncbi:50S ribosomal protein L10-like isoform X2 [Anneissia japonica]|nr:50S ribosomal protein L10-like isoform X2 [Anneissia japonica]